MDKKNKLFSIKKEHESASKHVSGKAKYIDDIPEPKNLLHTAIGYSQIAKGKIKSINLKEVTKSEGVIDVITYKDIPGINDVGPVFKGDPIFAKKNIEYFGQPIFAVAAILTPPDPITQIGLGIPLLILYELSILSVSLIEKKKDNARN